MTDFGTDILCLDSLQTGRFARGARVVAQRCYHRLITPRGTLRGGEDERNFGLDLAGMVGASTTPELSAAMPQRIKNELEKDAAVDSVSVVQVESVEDNATTWTFTIAAKTKAGPFTLVLAVDDVTVELLEVTT